MWLPDSGIGFLGGASGREVYDEDYLEKYRGYERTEQGRELTKARCGLVEHWLGEGTICDVGVGSGHFVRELQARGNCWVRGFDVNPEAVAMLHRQGVWADPYRERFDALTFWDSLEHVRDPRPLLVSAASYVFMTIPLVPGEGPPSRAWKHYRPLEHCWYFTEGGLRAFMWREGFRAADWSRMEEGLGREDVGTFVFLRR